MTNKKGIDNPYGKKPAKKPAKKKAKSKKAKYGY
tara:strand:- start:514 stop:615 length:102 start_codon:yes stop_codon:yes gene_type:complete